MAQKRTQTRISCTNGNGKMKIKSKRNFQVSYSFMKILSGNLKILAPCCDVIISKSVKKPQVCISCTTGGKNIKIKNYNNLVWKFFCDGRISEFWNINRSCDDIIPKLELSWQNLYLGCVFQPLEIAGFDRRFSWLSYGRVTFKDTCF